MVLQAKRRKAEELKELARSIREKNARLVGLPHLLFVGCCHAAVDVCVGGTAFGIQAE